MDERKSVEGTNAARDKPMVSDSSAQTEHAAWQDGARTPIGTARACHVARWRRRRPFVGTAHAPASARPAPVKSTAQESERSSERNSIELTEALCPRYFRMHFPVSMLHRMAVSSFGAGLFGPPPGTRDWSIVRDCSSSLPMGC